MKHLAHRPVWGWLWIALVVLSVSIAVETILVQGFLFYEPRILRILVGMLRPATVAVYFIWVALRLVSSGWNARLLIPDLVLSAFVLSTLLPFEVAGTVVAFRMTLSLVVLVFRTTGLARIAAQMRLNPARVLLLSFFGAIAAGTFLLMLPAATVDHLGAGFLDAMFTATSATCVTGLIVQQTGTYFTGYGQTVILLLIQVGGLGIMTLSTLFVMIVGVRLGVRQEEQMRGMLESSSPLEMYTLIAQIIRITLFFEALGALILFFVWQPVMGGRMALVNAVFNSVAAFCNAGFSLWSNNLMDYAGNWYVNIVIMVLIISGGLGFVVIDDLMANMRRFNPFTIRWTRLEVQTRLVLIGTVFLIVAGALGVFFYEFDNTLLTLSIPDKLLASLFQSVTARTAGFNTIDIAQLRDVTLLILIVLMFIGVAPSSTGGGVKITTFSVLLLSVRTLITRRERVEIFRRTIPNETVFKSIAIFLFYQTFLVVFVILILATQQGRFIDLLFESVSAMGTVGLSTGATFQLNGIGKVLISILMFVGRVGPLTLAMALREDQRIKTSYPTTRVTVG